MPTSKKKKTSSKKAPSLTVQGGISTIPKLKLDFPLDAKKVAAIQRCIAKGTLSVTVSRVDLAGGRLGEAWLYD